MTQNRKRVNLAKHRHWQETIREAARSGLPIREFCRRQGVTLSRKTMCDWMRRCADLVSPLYDRMRECVLESKVMQTDDTPVNVLDPSLPRTRIGRIWTYVGDRDHPYTVYDYTPTRSRDGPDVFVTGFHGYLQADAYTGYDELYRDRSRKIIEVACWAHARRRFFEAQTSDPMRSTVVLAYVRLLYDVEREARTMALSGEARKALRQTKSVPILEDIKTYLEREQPAVLPKSPEGAAISYTLSNWNALVRYCDDGDLEIDNNLIYAARGIAIGRRNWNCLGSDNGGRTAAILTSITTTCKRLDVDPFEYMRDVFHRISTHPQNNLGVALAQIGQLNKAVEHFKKALEINNSLVIARDHLKIVQQKIEESRRPSNSSAKAK